MDETTLQVLAWCGAFWIGVLGFMARQRTARFGTRYIVGLGLGAVLAHLGWAALHPGVVRAQPLVVLEPAVGFTVLWVPLGLLLSVPWRARAAPRGAYLAAAFRALPAALAVARLGCLAAGCCRGRPASLPSLAVVVDGVAVWPTPLLEVTGLTALFLLARRLSDAWIPTTVLCGIGLVRLGLEPLRAPSPLGPPVVPASVLAVAWVLVGLALSPPSGSEAARRPSSAFR